ncbi:hypothetical protein [Nostoc sp. LEGE 12450]|uniref:hypothetical protein n=1 Tax=Nostoc sp. LEGE 12450 TaxID=1828643 RepID=UPI001881254E|nr:hypothetical protein [Nostoc sp. LEGE 12450]MBE8986265.1 hypothetical protein [Nostoc sp. LEGE 12450]
MTYRTEAQEISTIFGYWSFQQEKAFEPKSTYSTKPETEDYDTNSRFKERLATILRFGALHKCGITPALT